ncbi:MAG: hypothetical protein ACJA13_002758 [Paraglaciecola sp.]|jgi:hypothetical protein
MIRLTQRAWNNVLIFSMLLLIVLFNLTGGLFKRDDPNPSPFIQLLPLNAVVMSIELDSRTIERVGRGWRLLPDGADPQFLAALVANWQQAELEAIGQVKLKPTQVVTVWLAGEEQGRVYLFAQEGSDMLVQINGKIYKVLNMTWPALLNVDKKNA